MSFKACCRLLGVTMLLAASASQARSSPNFSLVVSLGGIEDLSVGQTVQCRAFQAAVLRDGAAKPLRIPLRWTLRPGGLATIDKHGLLTALKPGFVTIQVNDTRVAPKGGLPAGTTGIAGLNVRAKTELSGDRLPRVVGVSDLLHFSLAWQGKPKSPRLFVRVTTLDWVFWFEAPPASGTKFPWTCQADVIARCCAKNTYHGPLFAEVTERWRTNVTGASVIIHSWKAGIATGVVKGRTSVGQTYDVTFTARLDDPHGLLAKAKPR